VSQRHAMSAKIWRHLAMSPTCRRHVELRFYLVMYITSYHTYRPTIAVRKYLRYHGAYINERDSSPIKIKANRAYPMDVLFPKGLSQTDKIKCPQNPANPPENLKMQGRVRSRHKTLNGRLKNWGILSQTFRHEYPYMVDQSSMHLQEGIE